MYVAIIIPGSRWQPNPEPAPALLPGPPTLAPSALWSAQANIGCQGVADLGDIHAGMEHCTATGLVNPSAKWGIFGGSYGGYMTLKALYVGAASPTRPLSRLLGSPWLRLIDQRAHQALCGASRFAAGVALYGFTCGR
jgi:hypothetical protein